MNSYESLIQQLDQFIRKFYLNKILKGSLLFIASTLSLYLLLSFGEFAFYFPSWIKWFSILLFVGISSFALISWIIIPLSKYLKISTGITQEEAAKIIGKHFNEVQDKLLNILQLKNTLATSGSQELIEASIKQKTEQISWIPFTNAIDLTENKRFLRYAVPPIILLVSIILIAPNVLLESNARLLQPAKTFTKPAPFDIIIDKDDLNVQQFTNAEIIIKVKGKTLPNQLDWIQNSQSFPVNKIDANTFSYVVHSVEHDFNFKILANGFLSQEYTVKVIKKPIVSSMQLQLSYPTYTKLKNKTIKNIGDIVVPVGTQIKWILATKNTKKVAVKFNDTPITNISLEQGKYTFSKRAVRDHSYMLYTFNQDNPTGDSVLYSITVIEDEYPVVQVQQVIDTSQANQFFFMGNASDDYAVSLVSFHMVVKNEKGQIKKTIQNNVSTPNTSMTDFTHHFSLNQLDLKAGDKAEYYFTVWDNDGINGRKSTRSNTFTYSVPNKKELKEMEQANNENIKSALQSTSQEVQKFSEELQSVKEMMLTKKNLSWEDKKNLQDLLQRHEQLKKNIEEIKNKYDDNLENQNLYKEVEEDIEEKQELINEIMEELLRPELMDLMSELQELLEKLQKNEAFDKLEQIEMSNQRMNRELDKILELFKKLEFEQKINEFTDQLDKLSQKQQDIIDQEKSALQEQLNKEFEDLKKELDNLEKSNQEQKSKINLDESKKIADEVKENMNQAKEDLDNNKSKPAKEKQQNASDGMQQMAQNLRAKMQKMKLEQHVEDINTIRRLLSNLLNLSMEQEDLMLRVRKTHETDVKFGQLKQEQQVLIEKSVIIEDSLTALGKRVFQLKPFITDELYTLKRDLSKSIKLLDEKKRGPATAAQQYAMTSANNLALMLSETMNQMQLQMPNMGGEGSCDNPDGNNPSLPTPGELKKLQEQLGNDLGEMGKKLQEGHSGQEINKQLAEMAQRQAVIRESLRKMREAMSQNQKKNSGIDQLIDDLEQIEKDIVNKKINQETLLRQKNIETRMLELENATREQDENNNRLSNTAKETPVKLPPQIEDFIKNKKDNTSFLELLPPEMKPFYRRLVNEYKSK